MEVTAASDNQQIQDATDGGSPDDGQGNKENDRSQSDLDSYRQVNEESDQSDSHLEDSAMADVQDVSEEEDRPTSQRVRSSIPRSTLHQGLMMTPADKSMVSLQLMEGGDEDSPPY